MLGSDLSLRIQIVLYGNTFFDVERLVSAITASVRCARRTAPKLEARIFFGDCSSSRCLSEAEIAALQQSARDGGVADCAYQFFSANLGSAGGSNRLAAGAREPFILILNPDTYPSPPLISRLLGVFADDSVGCADARQIPLEHPKAYDRQTGDTSWASGSCIMVRSEVFRKVGGFDDAHFFLYCDDVDLSWRIRAAGHRVVHAPAAVVFHDKRLDSTGAVRPTDQEEYYGVLGRIMLAQRYGRQDILTETIGTVRSTGTAEGRRAVKEWERRLASRQVPAFLTVSDEVAQFIGGNYAVHRF